MRGGQRHLIVTLALLALAAIRLGMRCQEDAKAPKAVKTWQVGAFEVTQYLDGPDMTFGQEYHLVENGRLRSKHGFRVDQCRIDFRITAGHYCSVHVCENEVRDMLASEDLPVVAHVDSAMMIRSSDKAKLRLSDSGLQQFLADWHEGHIIGHIDHLGAMPQLSFGFELHIFMNRGEIWRLKGKDHLLLAPLGWVFAPKGSEDAKYFRRLWHAASAGHETH